MASETQRPATRAIMCGHCHGVVADQDTVDQYPPQKLETLHRSCWHTGEPTWPELIERGSEARRCAEEIEWLISNHATSDLTSRDAELGAFAAKWREGR